MRGHVGKCCIEKIWAYHLEMDHRHFIDVSGLTLEEVAHIQQVVNDIRKAELRKR